METHQNSDSGNGLNVDQPIKEAGEDLLGRGDFVRSLATSIRGIKNNEGSFVIALSGSWGSGKTSILNLLKAELESTTQSDDKEVALQEFSCLYTQNEAAMLNRLIEIIQEFFPGKKFISNKEIFFELIDDIGRLDYRLGLFVRLTKCFRKKKNASAAEEIIKELRETFRKQEDKKFVLFIDDIDRLPPNKVITIFRLVKTLGDMPNLVIVLSYDNEIVSKLVQQEYEAEGEVFMDKMVQAIRSVPPLSQMDKRKLIEKFLKEHLPQEDDWRNTTDTRYLEAIKIVSDLIATPRDVKRLGNELQLYGPSAKELNREDMLVLQTLQIKKPDIYEFIRKDGRKFCPSYFWLHGSSVADIKIFRKTVQGFLHDPDNERQVFESVVGFLFPGNDIFLKEMDDEDKEIANYPSEREISLEDLKSYCRLASPDYFQTYFSLIMSENALSASDAEILLNAARDKDKLKEFLRYELNRQDCPVNRFDLLMDEMRYFFDRLDVELIRENILLTVFELADDIIYYYRDKMNAVMGSDSYVNIFFLVNTYTQHHMTLEEKETLLSKAMDYASQHSVVWFWIFAGRAYQQHHTEQGRRETLEYKWWFGPEKSEALMSQAHGLFPAHLEDALKRYAYLGHFLLHIWSNEGQNDAAIKEWTDKRLSNDRFVLNLAEAFTETSQMYSEREGRIESIRAEWPSDKWVDIDRFEERCRELARRSNETNPEIVLRIPALKKYLQAIDNQLPPEPPIA